MVPGLQDLRQHSGQLFSCMWKVRGTDLASGMPNPESYPATLQLLRSQEMPEILDQMPAWK